MQALTGKHLGVAGESTHNGCIKTLLTQVSFCCRLQERVKKEEEVLDQQAFQEEEEEEVRTTSSTWFNSE